MLKPCVDFLFFKEEEEKSHKKKELKRLIGKPIDQINYRNEINKQNSWRGEMKQTYG
jgi:hypothetical protein